MSRWDAQLKVNGRGTRLVVTDGLGHDVLKARLPIRTEHPRGLLTLLEGVALYSGSVLLVATSVADAPAPSLGSGPLGEGLCPVDSALVRFEPAERPCHRSRLDGVGDFRDVRQLKLWVGR